MLYPLFQLVIDIKSVCLSLWIDAKTRLSKASGHRDLLDIPRRKRHLQLETQYQGRFSVRCPQSMVRFLVQITSGRCVDLIARDQLGEGRDSRRWSAFGAVWGAIGHNLGLSQGPPRVDEPSPVALTLIVEIEHKRVASAMLRMRYAKN